MEIVYNPPPTKSGLRLSMLCIGDLFKLSGSKAVYMKVAGNEVGGHRIGEFVAVGLHDGGFYTFTDQEVIQLDGKLTVWEV